MGESSLLAQAWSEGSSNSGHLEEVRSRMCCPGTGGELTYLATKAEEQQGVPIGPPRKISTKGRDFSFLHGRMEKNIKIYPKIGQEDLFPY